MVLLDIGSWWNGLMTVEKIYWGIAILASIFFLIQLVITFMGADADVDMEMDLSTDMEVEMDHGMGFQFFTLKNLLGFFTLFGWTGLGCLDMGLSLFPTLAISSASGLVMMTIMATIFYFMSQMTDSGTINMKNAIGQTGTVYLVIPAKRAAIGKVSLEIQGRNMEMNAITDDETEIPTGGVVVVSQVINNGLLLVKRQ
ncbi:MAG: hypothetical protein GC178_06670 [Flavobacteriales bacterium]|nr:hypothetical protein [Flavobacteriales bacterium]